MPVLESAEEVSSILRTELSEFTRNIRMQRPPHTHTHTPENKDLFQTRQGGRVFMFSQFEVV